MRKAMIVAGILSLSFGAAIPGMGRNAPQDTAAGVSTDFHGVDALIRKQLVRER